MPNQEPRRQVFQKTYRICSKKEINDLFQNGRYCTQGMLRFRFKTNNRTHFRLVISISKRVGKAPTRNRIKRLIRETLRQTEFIHQFSIDCAIFITHPPRKKPTLMEMKKRIHRFFDQLPV